MKNKHIKVKMKTQKNIRLLNALWLASFVP